MPAEIPFVVLEAGDRAPVVLHSLNRPILELEAADDLLPHLRALVVDPE
ncbi:MAG: hypothetical protein M3O50_00305 [Myxococcota bacterium]|nr:hypothetical protein [Myxococcota bacterium]